MREVVNSADTAPHSLAEILSYFRRQSWMCPVAALSTPSGREWAAMNIEKPRALDSLYEPYGFFNAVNPITGQVAHRYLVLDQAMILAALDNVLQCQAMQQHFAHDPVIAATQAYLERETFSL